MLVKPTRVRAGRENHGHAIMKLLHEIIRVGGDDRTRAHLVAVVVLPILPKARERESLLRLQTDVMRNFRLAVGEFFPLVKSVRGEKAAAPSIRLLEGVLFAKRFRAGVAEF